MIASDLTRYSPPWMQGSCPSWCVRTHTDTDREEDRFHQSEPSVVPVLASRADATPASAAMESYDAIVRVVRHAGEVVDWLAIEPLELADGRLILTAESARALSVTIDEQLRRCNA